MRTRSGRIRRATGLTLSACAAAIATVSATVSAAVSAAVSATAIAAGAAATVAATVAATIAAPLEAQERRLELERFDAVIEVRENGSIEVRETLQVRFIGSWNGIFRRIPVRYEDNTGFGYKLFLDVGGVTNEAGQALEYWEDVDGGYREVKIAVPGARDAVRTVRIRYEVENGLRYFDEHDELYWNVTGTEWPMPIRAASARVVLPEGVTGVRSTAYTGHYGSTATDVTTQNLGGEIYFETDRSLEFREGLTIVVGWDPGVVARPSGFQKTVRFFRSNVLLLIPFLSFWGFFRAWKTRGRDPKTGPITTQYEPPDGLKPAEIGTLIDGRPDMHDLTATLVDLAVRGYIRLEETEKSGFLGLGGKDIRIHRVRDEDSWSALQRHERKTLQGIFESHTDSVELSDLKAEYYTHLSGIRDAIWDHLLELGFYDERPDKVRAKWIGLAILATAIVMVGSLFFASRYFLPTITAVIAGVGTLIPAVFFAFLMPARTPSGVKALERTLGFEEFLSRVDGDRIRRMNLSSETFEKLLPYAMALRVEEKWAKAFEGIYTEPPQWYSGPHTHGPFTPRIFVSDLGGMTQKVGSTMASTPARSSGSSGFSGGGGGGGFSGGGFGGGGGGGW